MSEKRNLNFEKYKALIIAIVIIMIVIILDIIFENYSKKSIEKINGNIEKIANIFENQEESEYVISELEKLSENACKEWEKREDLLACFIEHEEIEKVNVKLHLLHTEIKNGIWADAKSTTSETKQLVKYLNVKHKLSLQNLF
ncbi:MAG: DUF4363 family protein [Clostridia bacterium]|nr:DUF4363 family protein [Clostridia bacterium]